MLHDVEAFLGGHLVVADHVHDDLTIDPSSHHVITTIVVDYSMIPARGTLESVALQQRTLDSALLASDSENGSKVARRSVPSM